MKISKTLSHSFLAIALLVVVELILRGLGWGDPPIAILDDSVEYYPAPSSSYNRYGNQIEINRYGMRSRDFSRSDPSGLHVTILGDSVVYGNHFLDQSETIGYRLNEKIERDYSGALVSVIAASSWGPQNIEAFFNKTGPFTGQIAVLVQSAQDRYDVMNQSPSLVPYRTRKSLTAIGDFALRIWEWARTRWFPERTIERPLPLNEAYDITDKSLSRLLTSLKGNYDAVILYYHATSNEIDDVAEDPDEKYYRNKARDSGVHYIDSRVIYGAARWPNDIFEDDIHLSSEGSEYVAHFLYSWFIQNDFFSTAKK